LFIFESIVRFWGYWKSTYSIIACYTSANLENPDMLIKIAVKALHK